MLARPRRVPSAERLSPAGLPPNVAWEQRTVHVVAPDQFRITVPCMLADAVASGVHRGLTEELRNRWVLRRATAPWEITGVVAAIEPHLPHVGRITLAISATCSAPAGAAPAHPRMAGDLSRALAVAIPERGAIR